MSIEKLVWKESETPSELHLLLTTLADEYPIVKDERGFRIKFSKIQSKETYLKVSRIHNGMLIEYSNIAAVARGIGSALAKLECEETTSFTTLGIMLDVSRNMVMTVDHLKKWFRHLILSGYNMIMLYTEDTYKIEGETFFGYMRGGYSIEEIKELDKYASSLGIEMIGCIQTLGHLEQMMRYSCYDNIRDTSSVLLVDEDETYNFIDKMIKFWSEALGTDRIHIGMDETQDLGRGKFINKYGYDNPFEIFNRHLAKVNDICKKYSLKPMIWSDMYFRFSNPDHNYYDLVTPIPQEVQDRIPKDIELVYWDYYHTEADSYKKMLTRHRDIGYEPMMGSGIWTWVKPWYDHEKTLSTVIPCLEACRELKVKELFFTMWGDDGAYCNYDSSLAGISYSADLAFGVDANDEKTFSKRFEAINNSNFKAHLVASEITARLSKSNGDTLEVAAAPLLWDDPLMGILFNHYKNELAGFDLLLIKHYERIFTRILPFQENSNAGDFGYILNMLDLLIRKLELAGALQDAYQCNDRIALRLILSTLLPLTVNSAKEFDASFRKQWLKVAKPFGLENIQSRNATLLARLEELKVRINEYLDGKIEKIEEFEARANISIKCNTHCYKTSTGSLNNRW